MYLRHVCASGSQWVVWQTPPRANVRISAMCAQVLGETAMWFSTWISSFKWSANVRMLFRELDDLQRTCSQDPTPSAIVVSSALGWLQPPVGCTP